MDNKDKLSYRGVVSFYSQDEDGKRKLIAIHNAGTPYLARLFAYALVGADTSQIGPYALNVYDSGRSPILVADKLLTARHVENNFQDLVVFNHDLPYENYRAYFECHLETRDIIASSAQRAKRIVMLDKNGNTLAFIELEDAEFAEIFKYNEHLIIVWQMELIYDYMIEELPDEYK